MIALWLAYAVLVGAVAALVAALAERALRLWRLPVRGAWALAMAATIGVPLALLLRPAAPPPPPAAAGVVEIGTATAVALADAPPSLLDRLAGVRQAAAAALDALAPRLAALDRPLLALWALASLLLLAALARSVVRLRRRRATWALRVVDGHPVLVAPDTGPAVVGGGRARVVLPAWALDLDASLRRLVLRHETEHLRAGDPHLLLAAVVAAALAPWNLALWWQLGRLRLAVELDCDRRVLRAHGDVERYGLLLMAVGQRAGGLLRLATPALAEDPSALERRILAMTDRPVRRRALRAALLAALAAAATAAACALPGPNTVAGPADAPSAGAGAPTAAAPTEVDAGATFFEFQVEQPVAVVSGTRIAYPPELRAAGVGGSVIAQFVVDTAGRVEAGTFKVIESADPRFTEAVRATLESMVFQPAETGGRKVRQLVQMPYTFRVPGDTSTALPSRVRVPGDGTAGPARRTGTMVPLRRDGTAGAPVREPGPAVPLRADQRQPNQTYFEFQVEQPVVSLDAALPTYPAALQVEGVEGRVIAQFVVDAQGDVEPGTFKVIESSHELFSAAVRSALPRMRFQPARATRNGPAVKQLVQMPFVFSVGR